ncbi:hypothetical protein BCR35DRAFT_326931 [Leucosporidium creatinivorum]|uniref:MYND-type domain-containing protein n=1 Tax=Leucosporidium creatinivorum TaxID=106004 RepID=A0A1Y2DCD0_9BASI|nr:hypothetical protein BCR35DRAFT_326931 [Leucosporidium creatinivorum]
MPHSLELDGLHFPAFADLPPHGDAPLRGWVLLGVVFQDTSLLSRSVYWCRDREGKQFTVALYFDNGVPKPKIAVGNTLCLENATTHYFLDGQVGVRVEEPESIKVLKTSLHALTTLNKEMRVPSPEMKCSKCGKADSKNRCAKCQTLYCSKECQSADWTAGHKRRCLLAGQLVEWNKKYE